MIQKTGLTSGQQWRPADEQIEAEERPGAERAKQPARVAHVDEPGLEIALVPTRALL